MTSTRNSFDYYSQSALKILTDKPTGKRTLGRPRRRWEDNISMDLEEIGISAGNWVDSAQDMNYWRAFVNAALNLRVPYAMELVIRWTVQTKSSSLWSLLHCPFLSLLGPNIRT